MGVRLSAQVAAASIKGELFVESFCPSRFVIRAKTAQTISGSVSSSWHFSKLQTRVAVSGNTR